MNRNERIYIAIIAFLVITFSFLAIGIVPTATIVEIKNNNDNITASVSVRNIDTFFKRETKTIDHVSYCSIYKEEHEVRNRKTFSFNLIIFSSNEENALLVQKYNNSHDANILKDKLNDAIFNKQDITYTVRYYEYFFIGIVIFLAYLMVILGGRNGNDYKDTDKTKKKPKEEAEKEQVDNINDSIIK